VTAAPADAPTELTALLGRDSPGTDRRLSDLLDYRRAGGPVFLAGDVLRLAGTGDRVLYTAYRDVLPPRQASGTNWFADLVIYQGGELPGGELNRSAGHWNSPAQLEVFQTVSGRTLLITAWRTAGGQPMLRYQVCAPGTLAAVPFGAWHLTLVLDGPAAVFNLYTDLPGLRAGKPASASPFTERRAALHEQTKYRSGPAVEITARRAGPGFSLTGSACGLAAWGRGEPTAEPPWLRGIIADRTLSSFYTAADPLTLDGLCARAHSSLPAHTDRSTW